ncbi:MAG: hypothetical protein J4F36_05175 [Nitrosopumilaceae archaeon]|nr:hypothetical protein [Nitrosopumilaceae archaeon]
MSVNVNSQSFKEDVIAEIKRIQDELKTLKKILLKILQRENQLERL